MAYEAPAGNAIDFDLGNRYTPPVGDSINFNLEECESPVNLFDGKLTIKDTTVSLFDGFLFLGTFTQDLFDGKAQIKDTTLDFFDGEVFIHRSPRLWYIGGDLNAARIGLAGAGTQNAGLSFSSSVTEEYNGVSWSIGGSPGASRSFLAGCGTQGAGLNFGGNPLSSVTEEYNGTSWSSGGDLITARERLAGAGTQNAGLSFGGKAGSPESAKTEEYNGTSWSAGGDLSIARDLLAGAGTQNAGLAFGGHVQPSVAHALTEEYNGTIWSNGGNLTTARWGLGGFGIQKRAVSFGGYITATLHHVKSEEYDGTAWSNVGNLNVGRRELGGCGAQAGLSFGGASGNPATASAVTEEYAGVPLGTDIFDGAAKIHKTNSDLFDGWACIGFFSEDLFDGKIRIKDTETSLFDGFSMLSWGIPEVWISAANMPTTVTESTASGLQTAALSAAGYANLNCLSCFEYDGTSWSTATDSPHSISCRASCGYQTAALIFGGRYAGSETALTHEYNGTSWSAGGDLSITRDLLAGAGTQNAGLAFGGHDWWLGDPYCLNNTEEYNGTSWSAGGNLAVAKCNLGGAGVQNAALSFGGHDCSNVVGTTEEYDGAAWSSGGALNQARYKLGGCGSQTCSLSFGGSNNGTYYNNTEKYNGTAWSNVGDLITARRNLGGCGFQTFALSFGGYNGSNLNVTEEYSPAVSTDLFDGWLKAYKTTIDLFDGKAQIKDTTFDLFDGLIYVGNFKTDLFDGKLRIGLICRENLLGSFGEPYKIDIRNAFGFPFKIDINSTLGSSEIINILTGLGETIEYLLYIPMAQTGCQQVVSHLSDYINAIQILINALTPGDPFSSKQDLLIALQAEGGQVFLRNELSSMVANIQKLRTALTENVSSHVSLINKLALQNDIQSLLVLLGSMPDPVALYPDCTLNIYLEGLPIKPNQITDLSFVMDRGVTFDVLSFSSTDVRLYAKLQEIVGDKDSTLEVQYKGTSWFFLIEEVSGYELSYNVWGRSIAAAKSDAPFEDSVNFVLETDTLASVVAEDLVPNLSVTWNVVDWTVLADWSVDGTPVQKLKMLADSVGAVVRSYPDGTGFYVDEKYTTRPVDLPYAASVEDYDRDIDLMSLDASRDLGTGANSVTVHGHSPFSKYSIRLEAESCVDVGNPAVIKVYPALDGVGYKLIASDGSPVYQYSLSEEHIEIVSFVGGKGSVSYPIMSLKSITWDGATPAGFEYTAGQDEIVLTDETLAAVGEVVYSTRYDVWHGTHSGEGQLLVVCYLDEGGGIVTKVYFGEGDREADDIDRPILTSIEAAVAAGQAFLDDTSYNRLIRAIIVPCSAVSDGDVVSVLSDLSGVTGNTFVLRHEVSARVDNEALKITSNLDVVQFEV